MNDQKIQSKIRVLCFVGSMAGGGSERQLLEILKRINRNRFSIFLYLHHRSGQLLVDVPDDIPIDSFWDSFSGTLRSKWHHLVGTTDKARWDHLASCIARHRIDVVYSRTYLAALDAAKACTKTGIGRVSVCEADPLQEIDLHLQGDRTLAINQASDAFGTADQVVAVSDGIRQRLITDLSVPPSVCEVIPNGIDIAEVSSLADAGTADFPGKQMPSDWLPKDWIPSDRFNLLTVARLSPEKGHREFLKVLKRLVCEMGCEDLLWQIVGTGPLEEDLRAEVASEGLDRYVRFAGFQKNPYPYFKSADLFCLPSLHEAFGCVLIEAMACGLPVIATDCPSGPREVLADGRYGRLVPLDDEAEFANSIIDFRKNAAAWRDRAARSKSYAEKTFSFSLLIPRLEALLTKVAGKRTHSGH